MTDGYKLSRIGWEDNGRGRLPFVLESSGNMELCLGMDDEPPESLWARIRVQTNLNAVVGVCYKLRGQKEVYEAIFRRVEEDSCL